MTDATIDAVIFDLFGTLVTSDDGPTAYMSLAPHLPSSTRADAYRTALTTDVTLAEFVSQFPSLSDLELDVVHAQLERDLERVRLFDETLDVLARLRQLGLRTAVLSNLAAPYRAPFDRLGLDGHVDEVVFSFQEGFMKPDPEIYGVTAKRLGIEHDRLLMVGDSFEADVRGPGSVGIRALHLVRGEEPERGCIPDLTAVVDFVDG